MIEEKCSSFLYNAGIILGNFCLPVSISLIRVYFYSCPRTTVCFLWTTDLLRPMLPPQTRFFHSFFLTQKRPTFQMTPFCLSKNMCACATEFGHAGLFFGGAETTSPGGLGPPTFWAHGPMNFAFTQQN